MTTDVYIIDKMILQQILKKEKDGYGFTSRFIDFLAIECIIDNLPIYQQAHSHLTPLSYVGFVLIPHFLAKAKIDNLKRRTGSLEQPFLHVYEPVPLAKCCLFG
jgi:hypothetical protein